MGGVGVGGNELNYNFDLVLVRIIYFLNKYIKFL